MAAGDADSRGNWGLCTRCNERHLLVTIGEVVNIQYIQTKFTILFLYLGRNAT